MRSSDMLLARLLGDATPSIRRLSSNGRAGRQQQTKTCATGQWQLLEMLTGTRRILAMGTASCMRKLRRPLTLVSLLANPLPVLLTCLRTPDLSQVSTLKCLMTSPAPQATIAARAVPCLDGAWQPRRGMPTMFSRQVMCQLLIWM